MTLEDARAGSTVLLRFYHVPSFPSAGKGEAEALDLLAQIVGGDDSSRIYRHFVQGGLASTAGVSYLGNTLDSGRLAFVLIPLPKFSIEKIEADFDAIIDDVRQKGVTPEELERAKSSLEARQVFESDNQMTLARRYGEGVALGRSVADLNAVPKRVQEVSLETVKRVAAEFLVAKRAVTGILKPPAANATTPAVAKP